MLAHEGRNKQAEKRTQGLKNILCTFRDWVYFRIGLEFFKTLHEGLKQTGFEVLVYILGINTHKYGLYEKKNVAYSGSISQVIFRFPICQRRKTLLRNLNVLLI